MTVWDVAVIGGGIAGSTAAALLAQQGLQVILLEKGTFPRHKVCGEFLSPEGAHVLQRLGAWPRLEAHQPPCIPYFTLTARGRASRHRLPLPGWGVSRWVLDQMLWEYAAECGVSTQACCAVEHVSGDFTRGFSLLVRPPGRSSMPLLARAILCATGRHWQSPGRSRTGQRNRGSRFVGIKAHFRGIPLDRHIELHTIPYGYCGMVEVSGGVTNLCCWIETEVLRRLGGRPQQLLASAVGDNVYLGMRLEKAQQLDPAWTTTSVASARAATPVTDRVWNIGDCAAMIAPLTGDGMGMALRAAELAATTLRAAFQQELSWDQATAAYARRWQEEFGSRLRWGRTLEAMFRQPRLAALSCLALDWSPALMDQMYRRTRQLLPVTRSVRQAS